MAERQRWSETGLWGNRDNETSESIHTKMMLRSRKIPARERPEPTTPSTPRTRKISTSPKTSSSEMRLYQGKRLRSLSCADEHEETPATPIKRPSKWPKNKSKRLDDIKGLEETPVRERGVRVHFRIDDSLLVKPDPSEFYSPVINLFSPRNGGPDCCSPPVQKVRRKGPKPEDVPYFSELPIDDTAVTFSPHAFMCTLPPPSESPCVSRKDIPFKTRSAPESTLVLDLDDTLVHCALTPPEDTEFTFQILFQDVHYKVYMKLRPHVKEFLETLSKMYEMFVFTTAKREYAEKILDVLDPQRKLIRHRLYQEDCACFLGHYIKNLNVLQRDLAKTIILDNAAHTCPYQNLNRIPVKSWLGDSSDKELLHLIPILEEMTQVEDVRTEISRKYHGGELLSEF